MGLELMKCDVCKGYFTSKELFKIKKERNIILDILYKFLDDQSDDFLFICKNCKKSYNGRA
jgi:hypothetical protein